jgi:hypothetical protein
MTTLDLWAVLLLFVTGNRVDAVMKSFGCMGYCLGNL